MHKDAFLIFVDPDSRRRAKLSTLLESMEYYLLPCESANEIFHAPPPHSIVLTFDDGKNVQAVISQLLRIKSWVSVIAYAERPHPRSIVSAIKNGATDYLEWPIDPKKLSEAIARIDRDDSAVDTAKYRQLYAKDLLNSLSKREREVAMALRDGASNAMIADKLNISPRTVEIHRANARKKVGAKTSAELALIASQAQPRPVRA